MSPLSPSATMVGRMRLPRSVGTTFGIRLRTCATQAFVVPRSMPMMGFSRGRAIPGSLARNLERHVVPARARLGVRLRLVRLVLRPRDPEQRGDDARVAHREL